MTRRKTTQQDRWGGVAVWRTGEPLQNAAFILQALPDGLLRARITSETGVISISRKLVVTMQILLENRQPAD